MSSRPMSSCVHVLNGPNLNLLGIREPEIYGRQTLEDVESLCRAVAEQFDLELVFRQTNAEHEMIGWLHEARKSVGIAINPAAFCYHSVPILDAIKMCECPVVEVHISNIHARVREAKWRDKTILTPVCTGMITGLGVQGYALAVDYIARLAQSRTGG
jgi:3-dehydroquinate dehydratase-2